jgi:hypothetical protein
MDSSALTKQVQANIIYSNYVIHAEVLYNGTITDTNPLLNIQGLQSLEATRDFSAFQQSFQASTPPTLPILSQGSITITWSGAVGASVFTFTLNDAPSTPSVLTSSSATWNGLATNTTYTVVMTATNTAGSVTSDPFVVTTGSPLPFAPTAPNTLAQTETDATGFTISWLGAAGATSYTFELDGSPVTTIVDPYAKTAAFTGLSSGSSYSVTITAVNSQGSTSSTPFTATT